MRSQEKGLHETIQILSNFVGKENIVKNIHKVPNFNDEPKMNQMAAVYQGSEELAGAFSLSLELAVMKAIAEAVERHCNYGFEKSDMISNLSEMRGNFLHPRLLSPFSAENLKDPIYRHFRISEKSAFGWVKGVCLTDKRKIYLPAQEVYLNYNFLKNEPIIRLPISTGAAGGTMLNSALVRGICEVIERDAIMISYLDMLSLPSIDIDSCPQSIRSLNRYFKKYFLEIKLLDATLDFGIPTVIAIILDKAENKACPVSFGSKCGFEADDAILGAISEAQNGRIYTRDLILQNTERPKKPAEISQFKNRSMFWTDESLVKSLNFFFEGRNEKFTGFDRFHGRRMPSDMKLEFLVNLAKKMGYKIYYKEITKTVIKRKGYRVVKTIIPGLHPLYIDELFPCKYNKRLETVPQKLGFKGRFTSYAKNDIPHPFL